VQFNAVEKDGDGIKKSGAFQAPEKAVKIDFRGLLSYNSKKWLPSGRNLKENVNCVGFL
jgi:hypothetical protein